MTDSKPRVDRRQLQEIVAGLTEGVLIADADGMIVWANEAALELHGCPQREELGADASEYRERFELRYRNHHVLTQAQYPIARLIGGEAFRDVVVVLARFDDPAFHRVLQLRGLILTDAAERAETYVVVCQDVTERFSAEERFERTFNANPAPALISRLSDHRHIKVNQGFLDMTGYERSVVLDATMYEIDVLDGADDRDGAVAALRGGQSISQREAQLRLPGGERKWVIVAGQPIEVGEELCMLFTFNDLQARKSVEISLRQSEERFATAFRLAPVPMAVCRLADFSLEETNEAFARDLGFESIASNASSQSVQRSTEHLRGVLAEALAAHGPVRGWEFTLPGPDDTSLTCTLSAEPFSQGEEAYALCVIEDVTARRQSESELGAAIETVMRDASWFSRSVIEKLAQLRQPGAPKSADMSDLTPREVQVLGLICEGLGDADIAARLQLSRYTVRNHVAALYSKIGVNRRSAAVVWGRERGIVGAVASGDGRSGQSPSAGP